MWTHRMPIFSFELLVGQSIQMIEIVTRQFTFFVAGMLCQQ